MKIDRDLYYDAAVFNKLVEAVRAHIEAKGPALATDLKDAMGVSRKYAIPVLRSFSTIGASRSAMATYERFSGIDSWPPLTRFSRPHNFSFVGPRRKIA